MSGRPSTGSNRRVPLHRIAHARAGDKGNRLNISLIAYHESAWPILLEQATARRVQDLFAHRGVSRVQRYELPRLRALNFVLDDVLEGGVNAGLNLDTHGKSNAFILLQMMVDIPADLPVAGPVPPDPGASDDARA